MGDVNYSATKTVEVKESRLRELIEAEAKLQALNEAGVDNWEGYPSAMEILENNS